MALSDSSSLLPSCLQDGRFLVEFYALHFDDVHHNACNQRYWLQYHLVGNIATPTSSATTHFIRPSDTSEALAVKQRLVPFRRWLNLTHSDTYLHGPFDFASVNGGKRVTEYLKPIGTSLLAKPTSSTMLYQNLICPLGLHMQITASTSHFAIHPMSPHYVRWQISTMIFHCLDKRSRHGQLRHLPHPTIFQCLDKRSQHSLHRLPPCFLAAKRDLSE